MDFRRISMLISTMNKGNLDRSALRPLDEINTITAELVLRRWVIIIDELLPYFRLCTVPVLVFPDSRDMSHESGNFPEVLLMVWPFSLFGIV